MFKVLGVWLAALAAILTILVTIVNQGGQLIDGLRKVFPPIPEKPTLVVGPPKPNENVSQGQPKQDVTQSPPIPQIPVPPSTQEKNAQGRGVLTFPDGRHYDGDYRGSRRLPVSVRETLRVVRVKS
jgi:hypothetical protein